jgi:hypothetical protein
LFARSGISKISIFKSIYLENHVSHNELWSNFCLKKWEELIYCGKSWNIWMFNVYEFCCFNLLRKTCTAFLFNEAALKFSKLSCLI